MRTSTTPALRSFRPGDWFAVLGENAAVLLPPGEKPRVGALWALVDDGAGFDVVLDALISGGLRELPGFALVATEDGTTRVVVRGDVRARATTAEGDEVLVDGREAATWAERSLTGVGSLRLEVGEVDPAPDDSPLTVRGGLVRVRSVSQPPEAPAAPEPDPGPEPAPIPEPEPVSEPLTEAVPALDLPSEAVPVPEPEPVSEPMTEAVPALDLPTEAVPVPTRPVARLVFSHGDEVAVDGPVLVGRAPVARAATGDAEPRLVTVPSPQQEISSTHLEVRPGDDEGGAVVTDLGSTNGSVLVQPGRPPEDLAAGTPVRLLPGAVLDLGDGVTIRVVEA